MRDIVTRSDGTLTRPRRILLTTALALAGTLAMAVASPAQAQAITLYEHNNFGGRHVTYAIGSADMSRFGPFFNDMASSFRNNTGFRWCAYEHANYGGAMLPIAPRSSRSSLGTWNDRISSIRKC